MRHLWHGADAESASHIWNLSTPYTERWWTMTMMTPYLRPPDPILTQRKKKHILSSQGTMGDCSTAPWRSTTLHGEDSHMSPCLYLRGLDFTGFCQAKQWHRTPHLESPWKYRINLICGSFGERDRSSLRHGSPSYCVKLRYSGAQCIALTACLQFMQMHSPRRSSKPLSTI